MLFLKLDLVSSFSFFSEFNSKRCTPFSWLSYICLLRELFRVFHISTLLFSCVLKCFNLLRNGTGCLLLFLSVVLTVVGPIFILHIPLDDISSISSISMFNAPLAVKISAIHDQPPINMQYFHFP